MKKCAVCGDTCSTNVRLAWRRDRDGKTVNVCMLCAESGKVNAESIDKYQDEGTIYIPDNADMVHERKSTRQSALLGTVRGRVRKATH